MQDPIKRHTKTRVLLEMEDETGRKTIVEMHKLETGSELRFHDDRTGESMDTLIEFIEHREVIEERGYPLPPICAVPKAGRTFVELRIFALSSPADQLDTGETYRMIRFEDVEAGVDPYSLLLGRAGS